MLFLVVLYLNGTLGCSGRQGESALLMEMITDPSRVSKKVPFIATRLAPFGECVSPLFYSVPSLVLFLEAHPVFQGWRDIILGPKQGGGIPV